MTTKTLAALALSDTLGACVSTSEIVPVGPDSYMVSSSTSGSALLAGRAPIVSAKEANKYCASQGRHMVIRRTDSAVIGLGNGTNALVFSCVTDTDPEYQRPNLRKDPNVLVQSQQAS
jgi:hypothetical protein